MAESVKSVNKRRSKRFPFRIRVKFGNKFPEFMGYTINLSRHGVVVESSKMYPEKTPLIFEVLDKLKKNEEQENGVKFIGKVVWSTYGLTNRGRMGIEFLTLSKVIENEYELKNYH